MVEEQFWQFNTGSSFVLCRFIHSLYRSEHNFLLNRIEEIISYKGIREINIVWTEKKINHEWRETKKTIAKTVCFQNMDDKAKVIAFLEDATGKTAKEVDPPSD